MYKYDGKIYEGRWKVIQKTGTRYTLENIYNHNQIIIHEKILLKVDRNETTISKHISHRMIKQGKGWFDW